MARYVCLFVYCPASVEWVSFMSNAITVFPYAVLMFINMHSTCIYTVFCTVLIFYEYVHYLYLYICTALVCILNFVQYLYL